MPFPGSDNQNFLGKRAANVMNKFVITELFALFYCKGMNNNRFL